MDNEDIETIYNFIDTVTVILPKYSTKIPEYCIDENSWLAIKKLLARTEYLEELIDTMETYYSITVEDLENCIKNDK